MKWDYARIIQAASIAAPVLIPEVQTLVSQFMVENPRMAMWIIGVAMFLHALREPLLPKKDGE